MWCTMQESDPQYTCVIAVKCSIDCLYLIHGKP